MKGKASPFGFVLHPRTRDRLKLTLLTPFSKNREGWAKSRCVNTHDGKVYRLNEFSNAAVIRLGDILCGYVNHPEIKSLTSQIPEGGPFFAALSAYPANGLTPCPADTYSSSGQKDSPTVVGSGRCGWAGHPPKSRNGSRKWPKVRLESA